jgi:hypothetical protein
MKSESAKQIAEERQSRVATRTKIFLKANGCMLTRTILAMLIRSTRHAICIDRRTHFVCMRIATEAPSQEFLSSDERAREA